MQSEFVWNWIRSEAPELSQRDPRLQTPTLLSIEDYEYLMAIVETGKGLPVVLAERIGGLFRDMPPSHFFAHRYPRVARASYVERHLDRAMEGVQKLLFPGSEYVSPSQAA